MNGLRCPKCSRLVRDGWQVDWATGISDGIECGCGAILEVAAYVVGDHDVEFKVRKRPGCMDPVEGGDDGATA